MATLTVTVSAGFAPLAATAEAGIPPDASITASFAPLGATVVASIPVDVDITASFAPLGAAAVATAPPKIIVGSLSQGVVNTPYHVGDAIYTSSISSTASVTSPVVDDGNIHPTSLNTASIPSPEVFEPYNGSVSLPALTATGEVYRTGVWYGSPQITLPTSTGTWLTGSVYNAEVNLPGLQAQGYTGLAGELTLPSITASGTMIPGRVSSGSLSIRPPSMVGEFVNGRVYNGDLVIRPRSTGETIPGRVFSGSLTLSMDLTGDMAVGVSYGGSVYLPSLEAEAAAYQGNLITGSFTLEALVAQGRTVDRSSRSFV